jgi:DNA repair protein SbcD/Mre11
MKLLHFADLHLDAPFAWAPPEAARLRRRNRRQALTRILQLAADERCDAILAAGDLFELDRVRPDTLEFLRSAFADVAITIYVAPGNHDWLSPRSPYLTVRWSPNVHIFGNDRLEPVTLRDGLTLWGAAHRAPANTANFFSGFRPDRGGIHVALAHASERTALPWQETGKHPHAPFEAADLEEAGLTHAFLGHYHVPRDAKRHTYPGNPDPLEFGEAGERGAVLAMLSPDGAVDRERRSVAVSEVHDLTVDLLGAAHAEEVAEAVAEALSGVSGFVRVTLVGEVAASLELDLGELRRLGEHLDGLQIRVGDISTGYDLAEIERETSVRGQFARSASGIEDPDLRRRVLLTGLRALEGRRDLEVA